jgi:acyl-CoA synthetase (AMP-forming)/AMP-acid ligase II
MPRLSPRSWIEAGRETRSILRTLRGAGLLDARFGVSMARALARWGPSASAGFSAAALRDPERAAVVDEAEPLPYGELDARTSAIARGLAGAELGPGRGIGILCRNHRGFVEATCAVGKLGADAVFLNIAFAGPQLRDVLEREDVAALVHDAEFAPLAKDAAGDRPRFLAWHEGEGSAPTLDELARRFASSSGPARPRRPGRVTILTSGTTGTPKGARREASATGFTTLVGMLEKLPMRVGETVVLAAPAFHAWGLGHVMIGGVLGSTLVLQRRFDPEATLAAVAENRAAVLVLIPVMMQRILALGPDVLRRYDTSTLRVVASSGSALPGELALRWMDTFGDTLHNIYGSTEVAQASIATPEDLRAAPGTAGRVPRGVMVRILDADGCELPRGATGRIFVGNAVQFEGYTGGGSKEVIDGLMSIGDLGRFDTEGRLFVEGRDDEMIVSGGENVFPSEVENLLADHPDVADVAVIGVPDPEFGEALRAFVVCRAGCTLTVEDVRDHVRTHLARYKVPRSVAFLDEIPRTASGKTLKRVLRERP